MLRKYNRWAVKHCTGARCSPLLLIPVVLIALGVLVYVYREAILLTMEIMALVMVSAIALATLSILGFYGVRGFMRYQRAHAVTGPGPVKAAEPVKGDPAVVGPPGTMAEEADWLADESTVLAWAKDGTLMAGTSKVRHEKTPKV